MSEDGARIREAMQNGSLHRIVIRCPIPKFIEKYCFITTKRELLAGWPDDAASRSTDLVAINIKSAIAMAMISLTSKFEVDGGDLMAVSKPNVGIFSRKKFQAKKLIIVPTALTIKQCGESDRPYFDVPSPDERIAGPFALSDPGAKAPSLAFKIRHVDSTESTKPNCAITKHSVAVSVGNAKVYDIKIPVVTNVRALNVGDELTLPKVSTMKKGARSRTWKKRFRSNHDEIQGTTTTVHGPTMGDIKGIPFKVIIDRPGTPLYVQLEEDLVMHLKACCEFEIKSGTVHRQHPSEKVPAELKVDIKEYPGLGFSYTKSQFVLKRTGDDGHVSARYRTASSAAEAMQSFESAQAGEDSQSNAGTSDGVAADDEKAELVEAEDD
ncbi:unnamed protein product [Prorocentrum cordatum]|uniref:FACT complex subunit SSRP1 n=1 Tax=Prorocentrum cordatum TaxID=2364126 RepID=A0ABN9UNV8_9DINO|nr:unnamed protein product [Polarella glacialis]